ncbi:class II aldolase and Adducin N-terminal domain-containing protein [Astrocystis sublimbata]|nr:class II aldolase and Adducin N-terminal domain-containing protein [Astrocystis sublimbata]
MIAKNIAQLLITFIDAQHILHNNGVIDAYGHLSVRNPNNASTFFLARDIAPALVRSGDDVVEYSVSDAEPVRLESPSGYIERYIHSEIYKRYAGINAVVHSHASAVIPYGINKVPLRAIVHTAGFLGPHVPIYNITKYYTPDTTQDLLVNNIDLGAALAGEFTNANGSSEGYPDYSVTLMMNHGFTTCATSIENAVFQSHYTVINADIQSQAVTDKGAYEGGLAGTSPSPKIGYLSPQEAHDTWLSLSQHTKRSWDLWWHDVRTNPFYVNELDP